MVFVSCSIENPSFDSQSKDTLVSKSQTFGSECKLSKSFLKDIVKNLGIYEDVKLDMFLREKQKLVKVATAVKTSRQAVRKNNTLHFFNHFFYIF